MLIFILHPVSGELRTVGLLRTGNPLWDPWDSPCSMREPEPVDGGPSGSQERCLLLRAVTLLSSLRKSPLN